jgi:hypothetical protein
MYNRKLRAEVKLNSTQHDIDLKLVKTKLAEHKARDAAALGSKQEKLKAERLTSKELLSSKDALLKESEKTRTQLKSELEKREKNLKKALDSVKSLRSTCDAQDSSQEEEQACQEGGEQD